MADTSKIEWCDSTFNPWIGCTKVSPACDHCYAEMATPSRTLGVEWGAGKPRHRTSAANWLLPWRWNARTFAQCADCGWRGEWPNTNAGSRGACPSCAEGALVHARRRVFCASLADWLDNEVQAEWLADLLDLIRRTPMLDWQLLTKRIGNWEARLTAAHQHVVKTMGGGTAEQRDHALWMLGMWIQDWIAGKPPANVWIGATICNQAEADRDVMKLLRVPAVVRFLSIEPMLGPVDLTRVCDRSGSRGLWINSIEAREANPAHDELVASLGPNYPYSRINWIIAGGESGSHARPSHPDWLRSLRDQCAAAGVPFLFKQWGEWVSVSEVAGEGRHHTFDGGATVRRVTKKAAGRLLDGKTHSEFPEVRHG